MAAIYLDHNATTAVRPQVWDAMRAAGDVLGNPASSHSAGRRARQVLEDARDRVAASLGAAPDEVIFTSGATEANNLALFGLSPDRGHILAAPIEHPCVVEPLQKLAARGAEVEWLPVNSRGHVTQADVLSRVREETRLVALMLVNHETGAIQPVRHVSKTLPKSVLLHCDAAQAVGKLPVNFRDLGVATLSASGHKFGGPTGVGVLLHRRGITVRPSFFGGHQQRGLRPGTESVPLAVGFATALELALAEREANLAKLENLRTWFLAGLPQPCIVSGPEPGDPGGLPTTLNVSFPGCRSDILLVALDLAGVACSTGSACSSGSLLPSPVLQAMGVPEEVLRSAIRFSFAPSLSEETVEEAARRVTRCVTQIRDRG